MKKLYCATCGAPVAEGTRPSGEWVSADGTCCIPLYYCNKMCLFKHIFEPHTMRRTAPYHKGNAPPLQRNMT